MDEKKTELLVLFASAAATAVVTAVVYFYSSWRSSASRVQVGTSERGTSVNFSNYNFNLRRYLDLFDLRYISLGTMFGVSIYAAVGEVTKKTGPSIVLSYLFAGIVSILSALSYTELGSRIPSTGFLYQFTFLAIGKLWGLFIGWSIILKHAIGCASIARACNAYIDDLSKNLMKLNMPNPSPRPCPAPYLDVHGLLYMILVLALSSLKKNLPSSLNTAFLIVNALVFGFILVSSLIFGSTTNWIDKDHGGFMARGFYATIAGAATLISTYIGYEVMGSVAEEDEYRRRNLSLTLIISIFGVTVLYMSLAAAFVSIVPWYKASVDAPFSDAYTAIGLPWGSCIITIGIVFSCTVSVMASALFVSRYIFAMARDGLMPEFLARLHPQTQIPVNATIFGCALCVFLTSIFSLQQLINFMSIGQLIACIFVAVCVIKLRYQPMTIQSCPTDDLRSLSLQEQSTSTVTSLDEETSLIPRIRSIFYLVQAITQNTPRSNSTGTIYKSIQESRFGFLFEWTNQYPPGTVPMYSLVVAIIFSSTTVAMFLFASTYIRECWFIVLSSSFLLITVVSVIFMFMFEHDDNIETYKTPCGLLLPFITIVINIALSMTIDATAWCCLGISMGVGYLLHFGCGCNLITSPHLRCNQHQHQS